MLKSQEKFNIYGNAMISTPVQGFKSTQMFTDLGYGGSGGVDYFCKPFWNWYQWRIFHESK